jgi:hypothetical protein
MRRRELVQSANLEMEKAWPVPSDGVRRDKVRSFISIPFFYDGNVAGVLELRSSRANCFQEHDVRTCQLMAGLLSEAFARNAELEWKRALAERATMLEALEKIKPQLEKLVEAPAASLAPVAPVHVPEPSEEDATSQCRGCGNELLEEESYCGICGAARASGAQDIQSKWASMWHMQQARQQNQDNAEEQALDLIPQLLREPPEPEPVIDVEAEPLHDENQVRIVPDETISEEIAPSPWSSAANARKWLEAQRPNREWLLRQWHLNRANIYLGVSLLLFLVALTGWGSRSARNYFGQTAAAATKSGKRPAARQLSLLERALVATGIAEAPPAPVYLGNPEAKVWVDLHTALYYCQGSDPYGKTPGGKFATQLEAQQDSFEPAFRKACE